MGVWLGLYQHGHFIVLPLPACWRAAICGMKLQTWAALWTCNNQCGWYGLGCCIDNAQKLAGMPVSVPVGPPAEDWVLW
jgi:hypothetical protein